MSAKSQALYRIVTIQNISDTAPNHDVVWAILLKLDQVGMRASDWNPMIRPFHLPRAAVCGRILIYQHHRIPCHGQFAINLILRNISSHSSLIIRIME